MSDALQPTSEHRDLERLVGRWSVACTMHLVEPGQPPVEYAATETVEMLGPFWALATFECETPRFSFSGRSLTGYDPARGRHVSTWCDSVNPSLYVFEGGVDSSGALRMRGEGMNPIDGTRTTFETVETFTGPDARTFAMSMAVDGRDVPFISYAYTRAR